MVRNLVFAAAALTMMTPAAFAAPCKDPKTGKFIRCPDKAPAKSTRCKAANGKFAKCGTPGAKSV